jgi:uncharacterized protein with HEPN domain
MQLEAKKYLYDVQQAAARIAEFTAGKRFEVCQSCAMLRAAAERQFEVISEAPAQLAGHCPWERKRPPQQGAT